MSAVRRFDVYVGVLEFDAVELRNIAYALGLHDVGAQDMLALADELDNLNGVPLDEDGKEDVESCAAVVFRGSRWGNNPEPDELCSEDAEPGSEFCAQHREDDDE